MLSRRTDNTDGFIESQVNRFAIVTRNFLSIYQHDIVPTSAPFSHTLPLIVMRPVAINRLVSLREQYPVSLMYLLIRMLHRFSCVILPQVHFS